MFPCCIAAGCSPGTRATKAGLVSVLHFRFQPEHFGFSWFAPYKKKKKWKVLYVLVLLPSFSLVSGLSSYSIFFLFRGWAYLFELRATASGLTEISMYILKGTRRKKKDLLFFCGILSFTKLSEATVLDDGSMEENNSYRKSIFQDVDLK